MAVTAVSVDPDEFDHMLHLARIFEMLDLQGKTLVEHDPEDLPHILRYINQWCEPEVQDEAGVRRVVLYWFEAYMLMYGAPEPKKPNAPGVDTPQ